ncbi:MAG: PhzF family phenazine biosynthesis protein [Spirochaetaceae bacterium]|nr:PhzF family phenazine biosynthesis protein [Spirochaetaceae bacterium]
MKIFIVDSFTQERFKGNPAAVAICNRVITETECRNIAMEMNLSETAFLYKKKESEYDLRWFTPEEEVDLCGHATLASAHILWEKSYENKESTLFFHTKSGLLTASWDNGWITLNFPSKPLEPSKGDSFLFKAIPGTIKTIHEDKDSYIIVMKNESDVKKMSPDFELLYKTRRKEVIVTAQSEKDNCDFVSRFFAPAIGIKEDPVTGSAHCYLAPYWAKILNKNELTGYQASKRGGFVRCTVVGDRVLLKGKACTVLVGEIHRA